MDRRRRKVDVWRRLSLAWMAASLLLAGGAASAQAAAAVVTVPNFLTGDDIGTLKAQHFGQWNLVPVSAITSNVDSKVPTAQHPTAGAEITAGQAVHLFVKGLGEDDATGYKVIIVILSIFILVLLGYIVLRKSKPMKTAD